MPKGTTLSEALAPFLNGKVRQSVDRCHALASHLHLIDATCPLDSECEPNAAAPISQRPSGGAAPA